MTRNSLWTTKDRQQIAIKDMTDHHLLSTIRVLREMSPIGTKFKTTPARRRQWLNAMANEAYFRGLALDPLQDNEPIHE